MSEWDILAPGPSAAKLVSKMQGNRLCVIGNAFELVQKADILVAADRGWWLKHPAAMEFPARKVCNFNGVPDVEYAGMPADINSGLLGLEIVARAGATKVRLYGFDMHGSHFFGEYANGLRNTTPGRRTVFNRQYAEWAVSHRSMQIINCTPGSALACFPFEEDEHES